MRQALYRKYRPQTFRDLVGQNPIRITLENEIANNRIAHAYLLAGPRGVGKTTTARLLAKAANCSKRKGAEPCNACEFCRDIAAGRLLDLIEIDAASHTGVDNVRENIIENARFTPQRAPYKVFIIDEVHMLSLSAFNALLKTLEEPPDHVIFILATTEIHRVPETIISRCQRFDFKRVNVDELIKRLQHIAKGEEVTVEEAILRSIARRAEGSVRDAEVLLAQMLALGEKNITEEEASLVIPRSNINLVIELFRLIGQKDSPAALALINKLMEEGAQLPEFTKEFIDFLRKVLLFKVSGLRDELTALALADETIEDIKHRLEVTSVDDLLTIIEKFSEKLRELKYASIVQLPLELAVLELIQANSRKTSRPEGSSRSTGGTRPATTPEEQQTAEEKQPRPRASGSAVQFEKIQKAWPRVINELRPHNHSLALSLKGALPVSVKDGKLVIGFRYKLHADRIKERSVRGLIEDALEKVVGSRLQVEALVLRGEQFEEIAKQQPLAAPNEGAWDQALRIFGSEIVAEK